jgi:transcription elongation GreA/GreB family factor
MDSPLGIEPARQALDDEVTVELPGGAQSFTVVAISYGSRPGVRMRLKRPECS